jgi:chemotaxis protein MotB
MKTRTLLLIVAAALAGCVSTSKYRKLESDSQARQKAMAAQQDEAVAKIAKLEGDLASSQAANTSLSQKADNLQQESEQTRSEYQDVVGQLQKEVQEGNLKVTQYENMLTVDVAEKLFFTSGSATLKASGKEVLSKVGTALANYPDKFIRVVGHTDNVPLSKAYSSAIPTNWELSVLRATNVVRYLQDNAKIAPERLIASGRGEYDPIAPNDTPEGRQKNRRIEITLIDKSAVSAMNARTK